MLHTSSGNDSTTLEVMNSQCCDITADKALKDIMELWAVIFPLGSEYFHKHFFFPFGLHIFWIVTKLLNHVLEIESRVHVASRHCPVKDPDWWAKLGLPGQAAPEGQCSWTRHQDRAALASAAFSDQITVGDWLQLALPSWLPAVQPLRKKGEDSNEIKWWKHDY